MSESDIKSVNSEKIPTIKQQKVFYTIHTTPGQVNSYQNINKAAFNATENWVSYIKL